MTVAGSELDQRPIRIEAGTFGQEAPLILSPQHGLLLTAPDGSEQLVRARHLARLRGGAVRVMNGCRGVRYYHLLFDTHQLVWANGLPAESFYPGPLALAGLTPQSRGALFAEVPAFARITSGTDIRRLYGAPVADYSRTRLLPSHVGDFRATLASGLIASGVPASPQKVA